MNRLELHRRDFLADVTRAAASGILALQVPWLASLTACAPPDDRGSGSPGFLTPAQTSTMRAFAARIIPSDDGTPGAEEADAVRFVDRALGTPFFAESAPVVRAGLADLDALARSLKSGRTFATLPVEQQIRVMRAVEHGPFFATARMLVIVGTFADPSHGGNRGGVGWTMIGMEHRPSYTAPFGWYDAQPDTQGARAGA